MSRMTVAVTLLAAAAAMPAQAQTRDAAPKWFAKVAISRLSLADGLRLAVGGTRIADAGARTEPRYTPSLEVGRRITPALAVAVTVGPPPEFTLTGSQTLAPFGRLAQVRAGPAAATLQYRPFHAGKVQPYLGAGAAYLVVFSTRDGTFNTVKVDNSVGPVVEGGADIMLHRHLGLFVEAKKAWIRTDAHGTFGGAPVLANVKLDPLVLSAGATVRF